MSVGFQYSAVNISDFGSPCRWSIPLSNRRIEVHQTATECALGQLADLLKHHNDQLTGQLIVNLLDSPEASGWQSQLSMRSLWTP